jgi:hypothetical protein
MNIKMLLLGMLVMLNTKTCILGMEPPAKIESKLEALPQELIHIIAGFLINPTNLRESVSNLRALELTNRRLRCIITSFTPRNALIGPLIRQQQINSEVLIGWRWGS